MKKADLKTYVSSNPFFCWIGLEVKEIEMDVASVNLRGRLTRQRENDREPLGLTLSLSSQCKSTFLTVTSMYCSGLLLESVQKHC
jgi:hypothetical protein